MPASVKMHYINRFYLLLFLRRGNYFFERNFESLKESLKKKKNLFNEKGCQRKFYKRNFVGYWKFGTKLKKG